MASRTVAICRDMGPPTPGPPGAQTPGKMALLGHQQKKRLRPFQNLGSFTPQILCQCPGQSPDRIGQAVD